MLGSHLLIARKTTDSARIVSRAWPRASYSQDQGNWCSAEARRSGCNGFIEIMQHQQASYRRQTDAFALLLLRIRGMNMYQYGITTRNTIKHIIRAPLTWSFGVNIRQM